MDCKGLKVSLENDGSLCASFALHLFDGTNIIIVRRTRRQDKVINIGFSGYQLIIDAIERPARGNGPEYVVSFGTT